MILDELAQEIFGWFCHQNPARTWVLGGVSLAMCGRCVGVYAGFALAGPLLVMMHKLPRRISWWLHGIFVVQVAVFGFHLIPHGLSVRTVSGQLFAIGVMYFLFRGIRPIEAGSSELKVRWLMAYVLGAVAAIIGLQLLVRLEWPWAVTIVNTLALVGLGVFLGLAVVCLVKLAKWLWRVGSHNLRAKPAGVWSSGN